MGNKDQSEFSNTKKGVTQKNRDDYKQKYVPVRFPISLYGSIEAEAKRRGVSVSELVRICVDSDLKHKVMEGYYEIFSDYEEVVKGFQAEIDRRERLIREYDKDLTRMIKEYNKRMKMLKELGNELHKVMGALEFLKEVGLWSYSPPQSKPVVN